MIGRGIRGTEAAALAAPFSIAWVAGVVNHGAYEDLERCLGAIGRQTCPPCATLVFDTGTDRERLATLCTGFPAVTFEAGSNRGYAGGANRLLARAAAEHPGAGFVLLLNPDVELHPRFTEVLLAAMQEQPRVAIASGKLLRPDGQIDSAGIRLPLHRRPRDRGSEEADRGQYDRVELVFAASGAAMMLRSAALDAIAIDGEVFDEDFFLYHEDTDLCWRAQRLGWQVLYHPSAQATHRRRWRRDRRREIEPWVRRHSFKNHYLQILKNESAAGLLRSLPVLLGWEVLRLGFALLQDRALLGGYGEAARLAPRAWRKRRAIRRKVRAQRGETNS